MAPTTTSNITASYTSPTSVKVFSHVLPSSAVTSTEEKTNYLSALRQSVVRLQDEVNGFLTTKMEEDKALTANAGLKADDKGEEENYGEEKVEEEG